MRLKPSPQRGARSSALTWGEPGLPAASSTARPGRCPPRHRYGSIAMAAPGGRAGRGGERSPGCSGRAPRLRSPPRICRGCGEPACLPSGRGRSSNAGMVTFRILEISSMGPASPSACPAHEGSLNLPVTKLTLGCPGCLSVQNLHNFLPCCYSPDLTARTTFCAQSEQSSYTTRKIL